MEFKISFLLWKSQAGGHRYLRFGLQSNSLIFQKVFFANMCRPSTFIENPDLCLPFKEWKPHPPRFSRRQPRAGVSGLCSCRQEAGSLGHQIPTCLDDAAALRPRLGREGGLFFGSYASEARPRPLSKHALSQVSRGPRSQGDLGKERRD